MTKRMIIDATHSEETRVALISEKNRLIDFDFESTTKINLKGNIYLAKIARVEPSLQAAFIDYGGNRHGFLAFGEIHPDYFRIPVSDREALKEEMRHAPLEGHSEETSVAPKSEDVLEHEASDEMSEEGKTLDMPVAILGGEAPPNDEDDLIPPKRPLLHQMYKIQEVIHKNQILLIQVVKEERGGKGAALSTFLSLAGRYSVLMPNSPRSGGVSRKISNPADRTRLKKILEELAIPDGMGLIVRTAGHERTKLEIKRDAEFLMRAWNTIRNLTLESIAPALISEEDSIIKRAIRDLYAKDVDEIYVEGEEGYKVARSFMKTLMPSHVKRVHHYRDPHLSLFHKYKVESQIDEMYTPFVQLPSGGSLVIHPTEALVSIDINSGRSTRERHIEETAVKTNLEAADEIARQVRLRDLAGLVVIDFIDMEDHHHTASVERRLREAFRNDRARIQMGKIGPFGLLELSRQRLRPSILETSAHPCLHCNGTGYVRSTESTSLYILRVIEEEALAGKTSEMQLHVPTLVAFYLLNIKREHLQQLEKRLKVRIFVEGDDTLMGTHYRLTRLKRRTGEVFEPSAPTLPSPQIEQDIEESEEEETVISSSQSGSTGEAFPRKRSRNRRSRQRHHKNREEGSSAVPGVDGVSSSSTESQEALPGSSEGGAQQESSEKQDTSSRRRFRSRHHGRHFHKRNRSHTAHKEGENVSTQAGAFEPVSQEASSSHPSLSKDFSEHQQGAGGEDFEKKKLKKAGGKSSSAHKAD